MVAAVAGALAGLAPVSATWRLRLTSLEVLALVGWLTLAVVGHAHKIVPFIAWSTLRARGVTTGPDGSPLLFAHLFHHPTARVTFAPPRWASPPPSPASPQPPPCWSGSVP